MSTKTVARKKITWDHAQHAFEVHLRSRRSSPLTTKAYLADVAFLREHLELSTPARATPEVLREAQHGLLTGACSRSKKPLAPSSTLRIVSAWRSFFEFLVQEGHLDTDPTARVDLPRVPRRAPAETLTVKEVQRLLEAPDPLTPKGVRDRAMLEVFFATAARSAELRALDLTDVDHERREVVIQAGKGEKSRVLPVTRSAYEALRAYLDDGRAGLVSAHPDSATALFLTARGRRVHSSTIFEVFKRHVAAAGIKKNTTPHTMRRTAATLLLKNGTSLRHIQALLGHASLDVTQVYLRLDREDLRRELLLRHPRERLDV